MTTITQFDIVTAHVYANGESNIDRCVSSYDEVGNEKIYFINRDTPDK
jgi:hypothetical protein